MTQNSNQNSDNSAPPPTETSPKKRGCGFWALIGIGILVAIGVLGSLLPEPTPEQKAATAAKAVENEKTEGDKQKAKAEAERASAIKVTAGELFKAYQANEMAAQQTYKGKLLEVFGTVDGVELDFADEPVIKLRSSNQFMPVSIKLTDETKSAAAGYSKGQKITLLCKEITEVVSMPQLSECVPVP